ncbi:MAG: DUF262 domain-containing protein [Xanthobacteraceae bacterium]|jgi:uncharacterized protein with ParB-like and HNH nuclease domain
MSLQTEIDKARVQVRTDEYGMSIGEIVRMYEQKELIINPSFQRLFRWEDHQKSKFIESILLGIPIPPIFVFETRAGEWELIDGLQRISTILEFMGLLRDAKTNRLRPSSRLNATSYLPSLSEMSWAGRDKDDQKKFSKPQQFEFQRARLNVQILKRPSDVHTKFDLFQRLNSGGSIATPQEVRNCAVIMVNEKFFRVLDDLANDTNFSKVSRITEAGEIKQKKLEFVMRFFAFTKFDFDPKYDVEEFIDKHIIEIADHEDMYLQIKETFLQTFQLLFATAGADALRRYDRQARRFIGGVGQVALEAVAVGVARNIDEIIQLPDARRFVLERIKSFWSEEDIKNFSASGVTGTKRLSETIPYGEDYFEP